jgi:hypothetical protein
MWIVQFTISNDRVLTFPPPRSVYWLRWQFSYHDHYLFSEPDGVVAPPRSSTLLSPFYWSLSAFFASEWIPTPSCGVDLTDILSLIFGERYFPMFYRNFRNTTSRRGICLPYLTI